MLRDSTPKHEIPPERCLFGDEVAWMKSYFGDVKGEALASAISMSTLEGSIVESSIVIGGDDIYKKAVARNEKQVKKETESNK